LKRLGGPVSTCASTIATKPPCPARLCGFEVRTALASAMTPLLVVLHRSRRAPCNTPRRPKVAAAAAAQQITRVQKQEERRRQAAMLESALLQLFQREEPNIIRVRDCLTRLARLDPRPNTAVKGDWIIFWASREGCVDRVFGSGATNEWWLNLQEFLIRLSSRKEGRLVEGIEIIRKVGPFPNQSNSLKGTYEPYGTNGLRINFTEIQSDDGKDVEVEGKIVKDKAVEVDVIYSSPGILALQTQDEAGECDFFVLTPIDDLEREREKLLGLERRRYLLN